MILPHYYSRGEFSLIYQTILAVHIVSAIVFFGFFIAHPFIFHRAKTKEELVQAMRVLGGMSFWYKYGDNTMFLTGVLLVFLSGIPVSSAWVLLTFTLFYFMKIKSNENGKVGMELSFMLDSGASEVDLLRVQRGNRLNSFVVVLLNLSLILVMVYKPFM